MTTRILLADDHLVVRQGLRSLLEQGGFVVVGEATDGQEAVRVARTVRFDVAVLDVSMPRMNGIDSAREIMSFAPNSRIVMLTVHTEERQIADALRAGIRGYIIKTQAADELINAIREVAGGGTYVSPQVSTLLLAAYINGSALGRNPLTVRERQVLQLVAEGRTTKEVAHSLGVTAKTAECYRSRLKVKLGIHDTAGLVRYAIRHGLIQLGASWFLDAIIPFAM